MGPGGDGRVDINEAAGCWLEMLLSSTSKKHNSQDFACDIPIFFIYNLKT